MTKDDAEKFAAKVKQQSIENKARIESLMQEDLQDEDGYPTEAALEIIKLWGYDDSKGLFDFIKSLWWMPSFGWHESDGKEDYGDHAICIYNISCGGWSGNEGLIRALQENWIIWSTTWVQSRRGGHYIFHDRLEKN